MDFFGRLDARDAATEVLPMLTPRQRGTRKGILVLVAGLIFGLVSALMTAIKEDFFVLMLPAAIVIVYGVMRILYAMLLEDDAARKKAARRASKDARREMSGSRKRNEHAGTKSRASLYQHGRPDRRDGPAAERDREYDPPARRRGTRLSS